jgi:hypothetical protein
MAESLISVAQFHSLKGTRRRSIAVRLTPAQWKTALDGLTYAEGRPPTDFKGIRLVETPGIGGGIALPECPSPCQFRFQDGKFKCACTAPDDTDPPEGGSGRFFEFCALVVGKRGTIQCVGRCSQDGQTCSPRPWQIPGSGVSLVSCGCSRR